MFNTSPVGPIWLEISISRHTKSQGPKKYRSGYKNEHIIQARGFTPAPWTLLVIGVVLLQ